ncbi:MAG: hypothetical protein HND52_18700 [Ignavibacteriae bacterium]|nr:hypothetical protein [Ignavibacteriota bacterium]NOG99994.1 hypothetical protein [Ignavibacteriota bacterium]
MKKRISIISIIIIFLISCVETDFVLDPQSSNTEGTISVMTNSQSLLVNESMQLQASAYDSENNPISSVQFNWSSTNSSILTVDQTGLVNGISAGQAWIVVSASGYKSDSTLISVLSNNQQLASIVVTPNSASLSPGEIQQFTAQGFDGNNQPINNLTFVWSSSDENVVSISTTGLATANNSGSANIIASYDGVQSSNVRVDVAGNSKSGTFMGNPATSYTVSGSAELVSSNSQLTLNFGSDFSSSSGPGLYVYLSPVNSVGANSVELGELISTTGAQSYSVPPGYSLSDFSYVIIHCKPFSVSFGSAEIN